MGSGKELFSQGREQKEVEKVVLLFTFFVLRRSLLLGRLVLERKKDDELQG